jgi:excisionase family DNA binding protein
MVPQIHAEITMKRRPPSTPRRMATVAEVARYLHVQPMTIYRLIRTGQLPAFKIGAEYRFDIDQLKKWIANREVKD